MSTFACRFIEELPKIYYGDSPLNEEFGGIVVLFNGQKVIASKYSCHYYLVDGHNVVTSTALPAALHQDRQWECCGLTSVDQQSRIYALHRSITSGELRVFTLDIVDNNILVAIDPPFIVPQAFRTLKTNSEFSVDWNQEKRIGDFFPAIGEITGPPDAVHPYACEALPNTLIGMACSPCYITAFHGYLIIGVTHYHCIKLMAKHTLKYIEEDEFKSWMPPSFLQKDSAYAQDVWWQASTFLENEEEFPMITAYTYFRHPVYFSSLVMFSTATGLCEKITHISSSPFLINPNTPYRRISSLLPYENDLFVGLTECPSEFIPMELLAWGNVPFTGAELPANSVQHAAKPFFKWWWEHHMTWDNPPVLYANPATSDGIAKYSLPALVTPYPTGLCGVTLPTKVSPPFSPFFDLKNSSLSGLAIDPMEARIFSIQKKSIFFFQTVDYMYTTHKGTQLIGEGADVYLGEIMENKETIFTVTLTNLSPTFGLSNITIAFTLSEAYIDFIYFEFSLNGTDWDLSIPLANLAPSASQVFYIKVLTDTAKIEPKPVEVQLTYTKNFN